MKSNWCLIVMSTIRRRRERQRGNQTPADVLHALPDAGTGERVPLQPLPDAPAPHRDRAQPLPERAANQNLVPEPAHEVEEGAQDRHHEHDAAPSHDAPPPPPPAPPPPPDHGRPDWRPQDIASAGRVLSPSPADSTQRLLLSSSPSSPSTVPPVVIVHQLTFSTNSSTFYSLLSIISAIISEELGCPTPLRAFLTCILTSIGSWVMQLDFCYCFSNYQ